MYNHTQLLKIKPPEKLEKASYGNGLYLYRYPTGRKTWIVRTFKDGKANEVRLGDFPAIGISDAQKLSIETKQQVKAGINPNQEKKAQKLHSQQAKLDALSFGELIQLYIDKVAVTHKGAKWETNRLLKIKKDFEPMMIKSAKDINQLDIIYFRNERSKQVSGSSVKRELDLLGSVFKYARRELRIIVGSPITDVEKPQESPHRERRPNEQEIIQILEYFKYEPTFQPVLKKQQAAWAFLFAIETAMRLGEICQMTWQHVYKDHVFLPDTKNGTARRVPLSKFASNLLDLMRGLDEVKVVTATSGTISSEFLDAMRKLKIDNLTFHDSRHEATTRLAQKLPIQDLGKVTGHKDIRMLMRYYNPTVSELAGRINEKN